MSQSCGSLLARLGNPTRNFELPTRQERFAESGSASDWLVPPIPGSDWSVDPDRDVGNLAHYSGSAWQFSI